MMEDSKCTGICDNCTSDCDEAEGKSTVTLTLDDGSVLECAILTIFPCDGNEYIALLPLDENGENEDGEVFVYRFTLINGMPNLDNIDSDEEYAKAADAFDEWMTNQTMEEFDSLLEYDSEADEEEPELN